MMRLVGESWWAGGWGYSGVTDKSVVRCRSQAASRLCSTTVRVR